MLKKKKKLTNKKPSARKQLAALLATPPAQTKKPRNKTEAKPVSRSPELAAFSYANAWDRVLQNAGRTRDHLMKVRRDELQTFLDKLRMKDMSSEELLRAHANFLKMAGTDSDPEVRKMFEPALARLQTFIIKRMERGRVSKKV